MNYASTENNKVPIGTEGPLYRAMMWPMVDDMSAWLAEDGVSYVNADYYLDGDLFNPLFGMYKNMFYDESDRFLSNVSANFTPIKHTFFVLRLDGTWVCRLI